MVTENIRRLRGILEAERAECEQLLAAIRKAIEALNEKPRPAAPAAKKDATRPTVKRRRRASIEEWRERVVTVLVQAEGTLTAEDVGKALALSPSHTAALLRRFEKSGDVEVAGRVSGRGNPFLWTATRPRGEAEMNDGGDLLEALRTSDEAEREIFAP